MAAGAGAAPAARAGSVTGSSVSRGVDGHLRDLGTCIDPDLLLWNPGISQKILQFVTGKIQDSGEKG
jgi:hypothetical protein